MYIHTYIDMYVLTSSYIYIHIYIYIKTFSKKVKRTLFW